MTPAERKVMEQALEYLMEYYASYGKQAAHHHRVAAALRTALEQPAPSVEPVPWKKLGCRSLTPPPDAKFQLGDTVRKTKGSQWHGKIVGTYSTTLTPEGYCVESSTEKGSVQIYPAAALEKEE